MQLIPLKSKRMQTGDDLFETLSRALGEAGELLKNDDLLVIASKVVSYHQGRLVKVNNSDEFRALIRKEADKVLDEGEMVLTLKNKVLIPNAGIDNSNTPENMSVLWPEAPFKDADKIAETLKIQSGIERLGVVISDSHCHPLRMGTAGIAIGWSGFEGVQDERGAKDLFGKEMHYTRIAIADNLASAANLLMGETDAAIPFVIVRGLDVNWTDKKASEDDYFIGPEDCLYKPLYSGRILD